MKLRLPVALLAMTAALAAAPAFGAFGLLSGTFATRISGKSAALNGTWTLKFPAAPGTTYRILRNGKEVVHGRFAGINGVLTIADQGGPYACKGVQRAAVYAYKLSGKSFTLKATVDGCAARKAVLTAQAFRKK